MSEVALACLASQEAEKKGKEIARQLPTTKAAPVDASQQIVKKQTELSKDNKETKTPEDVKTTEEPPTKEEVGRKKKNKARPAPLKDLALILIIVLETVLRQTCQFHPRHPHQRQPFPTKLSSASVLSSFPLFVSLCLELFAPYKTMVHHWPP